MRSPSKRRDLRVSTGFRCGGAFLSETEDWPKWVVFGRVKMSPRAVGRRPTHAGRAVSSYLLLNSLRGEGRLTDGGGPRVDVARDPVLSRFMDESRAFNERRRRRPLVMCRPCGRRKAKRRPGTGNRGGEGGGGENEKTPPPKRRRLREELSARRFFFLSPRSLLRFHGAKNIIIIITERGKKKKPWLKFTIDRCFLRSNLEEGTLLTPANIFQIHSFRISPLFLRPPPPPPPRFAILLSGLGSPVVESVEKREKYIHALKRDFTWLLNFSAVTTCFH